MSDIIIYRHILVEDALKKLYFDLTGGVSADMIVAACCSMLETSARGDFEKRCKAAASSFDGEMALATARSEKGNGLTLTWRFDDKAHERSVSEVRSMLDETLRKMGLSSGAIDFSMSVLNAITDAEASAHSVDSDKIHFHEVGRMAAIMNIAAAGLCWEKLAMSERDIIGSFISIGGGRVETAHGRLMIPTPATAHLLRGMRFRFGPFEGEMATPTGVAIVKKMLTSQTDGLPQPRRTGLGIGTRQFGPGPGCLTLFESGDD